MHAVIRHFASPVFWSLYHRLPADVRETADKYFALLKLAPSTLTSLEEDRRPLVRQGRSPLPGVGNGRSP